MITGFVLVLTQAGKEHFVYTQINAIEEVVECHPLFGEYDIIVKVQGKDAADIGMTVVEKIRSIPGITETKTLTSIRF
jgi:DNA-binding Lrp family transcriptional regulator